MSRARRSLPGGRTTRGDQGHLMLRERVVPQSEVIRAIVLEDSPCCGVSRTATIKPDPRPSSEPAPETERTEVEPSRRRNCHSAAPLSTFSRCFSRDAKGGVIKMTELSPTASGAVAGRRGRAGGRVDGHLAAVRLAGRPVPRVDRQPPRHRDLMHPAGLQLRSPWVIPTAAAS